MRKLTLKALLLSTGMIAAGIWLGRRAADEVHVVFNPGPAPYMMLILAGAMFGGGLLGPFSGVKRGAIIGGGATVAFLLLKAWGNG